jgi:hypothetical protein
LVKKVVKKILGKNFKGTLITDFYSAYNPLPYKKQKCLAHLFRELQEVKRETKEFLAFMEETLSYPSRWNETCYPSGEIRKRCFLT